MEREALERKAGLWQLPTARLNAHRPNLTAVEAAVSEGPSEIVLKRSLFGPGPTDLVMWRVCVQKPVSNAIRTACPAGDRTQDLNAKRKVTLDNK